MLLLHHTAAQAYKMVRPLLLYLFQLAERTEKSLVRILAHAACIDHSYIGLLYVFRFFISHLDEHARDSLGSRSFI